MCGSSYQGMRENLTAKAASQGTLQHNAALKPMNATMQKNMARGGMMSAFLGQVLRSNGYDTTGATTSQSSSTSVAIQKKKTGATG